MQSNETIKNEEEKMRKVILMLLSMIINAYGWEINTHRAIDRVAIESSKNLKTFVQKVGIQSNTTLYNNEQFEGYGITYLRYITNTEDGEGNGVAQWGQKFDSKPSYQKMIEAGTILEDAQWPNTVYFDGRFANHFYDAQFSGSGSRGLVYKGIRFLSADLWALRGIDTVNRHNLYSYTNALEYFKKGFTESDPKVRKKYQAKMLVSVGHLMHMVNDMSVPAHVRADPHGEGDVMEVWMRGGEDGKQSTGFRVSGNTVKSYADISKKPDNHVPKYRKFADFITQEAYWTATHFFSKDSIFTKKYPRESDTYEDLFYNGNGLEKYYIRSDSISGIPRGTKLAIRVKSYITNILKERYYRDNKLTMGFDMSTSFRGNYSVVTDNARILIPRAIANARNFVNYFFRGKVSASITNHKIVVKNISNAALVNNKATATFHPGAVYRFIYKGDDGRWYPFVFQYDASKHDGSVEFLGDMEGKYLMSRVASRIYVKPGESITIPIILDHDTTALIYGKTIMLVYDGDIGAERGLAVCRANNLTGGIFTTED